MIPRFSLIYFRLLTLIISVVFSSVLLAKPVQQLMIGASSLPQRVVSLNLCTDQLLMDMLPPDNLVGITQLSLDPALSYQYKKALRYSPHQGRIEEIIALKPDLIITGEFTTQASNALLEKLGYRVIKMGLPSTVTGIKQQILTLGQHVGRPQQAAEMVSRLNHSLARLKHSRVLNKPTAAIYYANGFTAGKHTIANEALTLAGFENIAAKKNLSFIAPLPMETLIDAQPEVLIFGRYLKNTDSMAHQVLAHPALRQFIQKSAVKTLSVPEKYWTCAGPSISAAVAHLQQTYHQAQHP